MASNTTQRTSIVPENAEIITWSKKVYAAIQNAERYAQQHDILFKEFDRLRDATQKSSNTTLIHHLAPVYNHCASQGYQPLIHYQPLRAAVLNWCKSAPVVDWQRPPDQQSRSPTPTIPPSPKPPIPLPTMIPTNRQPAARPPPPTPRMTTAKQRPEAGPSRPLPPVESGSKPSGPTKTPGKSGPKTDAKGKSKQTGKGNRSKNITSPEFVIEENDGDDDNDNDDDEDDEEETAVKNKLPNMAGFDRHLNKCRKCTERNHGCHVNPKATSPTAACYECNFWKLKCSRCPGRAEKPESVASPPIGGAPLEIVKARKSEGAESGAIAPPTKKPRGGKKKPTTIAPGEPGEYASELLDFFLFHGSQHALAMHLPPDIVERLARYESASRVDQEIVAGLSEKVARLEAENRSMRDWFSDRLLSVWENTRSRDAGVMQVLQNMHGLLMEESSRQDRLQVTAENLEALLKVSSLPPLDTPDSNNAANDSTPRPAHPPAPTVTNPTATTSTLEADTLPPFPQSGEHPASPSESEPQAKNKKRSGSAHPEGVKAKRSKVQ